MDPTLHAPREPVAELQQVLDFQQAHNQQAYNQSHSALLSIVKEKNDLMQINTSYADEIRLLRDKSEALENRFAQENQNLSKHLDATILSNKSLQEHSVRLSQEIKNLIECSKKSSDAHFREIMQKDAAISELKELVETGKEKSSRLETSVQIQSLAYNSVQRQLENIETQS